MKHQMVRQVLFSRHNLLPRISEFIFQAQIGKKSWLKPRVRKVLQAISVIFKKIASKLSSPYHLTYNKPDFGEQHPDNPQRYVVRPLCSSYMPSINLYSLAK